MTFANVNCRLYSKPRTPLIPALDPAGSNEALFLTKFDGKSLVNNIVFENGLGIDTAPIRNGVKIDLMANSNANLLIQTGNLDIADTIDPVVYLKQIFFTVNGELFSYRVSESPSAKGAPQLLSDTRGVSFGGSLEPITIDRDTNTYFNEVPYWNPLLVNEEYSTLSLLFKVEGGISTSRGIAQINISPVCVHQHGREDEKETKFIKQLSESIEVVAYTLDTTFTDSKDSYY